MPQTWIRSLGQDDPLEKEVATHSCSCLDNPMDRARQATVPGGPKSQTELSDYTFTFTWKYRKFQSISSWRWAWVCPLFWPMKWRELTRVSSRTVTPVPPILFPCYSTPEALDKKGVYDGSGSPCQPGSREQNLPCIWFGSIVWARYASFFAFSLCLHKIIWPILTETFASNILE